MNSLVFGNSVVLCQLVGLFDQSVVFRFFNPAPDLLLDQLAVAIDGRVTIPWSIYDG